ncbi:MAG: Rieske 2Fe-2S domain-containing protein [Planctomycetia bacterium]|nr:Rieske 2Fe-2S domain-containing protein [Planctomycetia bacterium]
MSAPTEDAFAAFPAAWYLFGAARELRRGPVSKSLFGKRLVAFRAASGALSVLDARCWHMQADLGRGRVRGDHLECPFHNWRYDAAGRCVAAAAAEIPSAARQRRYPVAEQNGYLFVFNGPEPLYPLPFFLGHAPADFVAGRPFRFVAECSWPMLVANGFDEAHFQAVHDRTLIGPGYVDCPAPFARRMNYTAHVTGRSLADRFIRLVLGDVVRVTITNFGGPLVLVTGEFRRARSYIFIAAQPISAHRTAVEVIVFGRKQGAWSPRRLLAPLSLWARRRLTQAFMQDDIDRLPGIRYSPHTLTEADRELREFFRWLAALPQSVGEGPAAASSGTLGEEQMKPAPEHTESPEKARSFSRARTDGRERIPL